MSASEASEALEEARAAFARADWESARDLFQRSLDIESGPEALDGLGRVSWWLGDTAAALELEAKAFAEYRRRDDREAAADVAVYLAAEYRIAGNASLANGWLGRGTRLLEEAGDCQARGWLAVELSKRAATPTEAEAHAREGAEIARRIGDAGLEGSALSHVGLALISQGRLEAGLEVLDESLAIATGGEAEDPMAIGDACCTTLVACEQMADANRARDWGRVISEFIRRRNYTPLLSWCRAVYGRFLIATGRWDEAEQELERALEDASRVANANRATALVHLAELRALQGRLEEAEQLLAGLEDRLAAIPPIVEVHLARDEINLAGEKIAHRLEATPSGDPGLGPLLAMSARVALIRGDGTVARAAIAAMEDAATAARRDDLVAYGRVLAARAARLGGDLADPHPLEEAIDSFAELELPLWEGEARLELARALKDERPALAVEQGRAALRVFEGLGAARYADEAAGYLRELGAPGRPAPRSDAVLTRREQQVLELLGQGLSNKEIAERLVISPKTAEHHVRHILAKLDLRNRAEAAAYVAREGVRAED
jgi:DNA-binding CsgD family transcriptional regulator